MFLIALFLSTLAGDGLIVNSGQFAEFLDPANTSEKPRHSAVNTESRIEQETCATLTSVRGTHYTIPISVGTPPQKFDLVADTGSSTLIVESCDCQKSGMCDAGNKCFVNEQSSTLNIKQRPSGPEVIVLMFGSGPIESMVASDVVSLGLLHCTLKEGVLLMVDQLLSFSGPFEGILGLGLPEILKPQEKLLKKVRPYNASENESRATNFPSIPPNSTQIGIGDIPFNASQTGVGFFGHITETDYIWTPKIYNHSDMEKSRFATKSPASPNSGRIDDAFLRRVGVERFSLCLSDEDWLGDHGVIRLNSAKLRDTFTNIGDMHWALDFRGISVGTAEKIGDLCSLDNMPVGQRSPCGAIMDSGTTYILGPTDDIQKLYGHICDQWPRCVNNYTAMQNAHVIANAAIQKTLTVNPWSNPRVPLLEKALVFTALLGDCASWFDDAVGLNELPVLSFHIADPSKNMSLELKLNPRSYIISKNQNEMRYVHEVIQGIGATITNYNKTGRKTWSCTPTFGAVDYPTPNNGPGWILGIPFFYEYVIHYDLSSQPPSIGFSREQCGDCEPPGNRTSRVTTQLNKRPQPGHLPRRIHGEPRIPSVNFEAPL